MDITQLITSAGAGVGLEPLLEHAVMQYIPDKLSFVKPAVSWLISAAWAIGQIALAGGDWKQAAANTVATVVFMELKHRSPWGADATPQGAAK